MPIKNSTLVWLDPAGANVEMTNETTDSTVMVLEIVPLGLALQAGALKFALLPNDTWKGSLQPGLYAFGIAFICPDQRTEIKLTFAGSATPTTVPDPVPPFGADAGDHASYSFLVDVK